MKPGMGPEVARNLPCKSAVWRVKGMNWPLFARIFFSVVLALMCGVSLFMLKPVNEMSQLRASSEWTHAEGNHVSRTEIEQHRQSETRSGEALCISAAVSCLFAACLLWKKPWWAIPFALWPFLAIIILLAPNFKVISSFSSGGGDSSAGADYQ